MNTQSDPPAIDWTNQSLASLMEHITTTHHAYCRAEITAILSLFREAIQADGKAHPELKEMQDLFVQMGRDLKVHMLKEEETLFPYIARMEETVIKGSPVAWPSFGSVESPIWIMIVEHVKTDDELSKIRQLSGDYNLPANVSQSYAELYSRLSAFNQDMERHIHSENQILFPRAARMEKDACDDATKETIGS